VIHNVAVQFSMTRRQVVITASVVLLGMLAAYYWFFLRWSTYEVSWDPPPGVSADGRTIRVNYVGGPANGDCRTEGRVSVDEWQDRVVLSVTVAELRFRAPARDLATTAPQLCIWTKPWGSASWSTATNSDSTGSAADSVQCPREGDGRPVVISRSATSADPRSRPLRMRLG
jgi:hypothetical protein